MQANAPLNFSNGANDFNDLAGKRATDAPVKKCLAHMLIWPLNIFAGGDLRACFEHRMPAFWLPFTFPVPKVEGVEADGSHATLTVPRV